MATKQCLDTKSRIIIGALGGISPIIISLLVVDIARLFPETGLMDGIGLSIRFMVLVFIGGMLGYLHTKEDEPFKLFQPGIAAPALLTTAINGNSISNQTYLKEQSSETQIHFFIKSAFTDEVDYKNKTLFKAQKVSKTQLFLRGLIGSKLLSEEDDWFLIAGSHKNISTAKAQVDDLKNLNYMSKTYQPVSNSGYYTVAIATNLDLKEAKKLKMEAIKNGLPEDTYLWKRK